MIDGNDQSRPLSAHFQVLEQKEVPLTALGITLLWGDQTLSKSASEASGFQGDEWIIHISNYSLRIMHVRYSIYLSFAYWKDLKFQMKAVSPGRVDDPSMKHLLVLGMSGYVGSSFCNLFWAVFEGPWICSFLSTLFYLFASVINKDNWAGWSVQSLALEHSESCRTTRHWPCDWSSMYHKALCLPHGVTYPDTYPLCLLHYPLLFIPTATIRPVQATDVATNTCCISTVCQEMF